MIRRGINDYFTNSRKKKHLVHASNKDSSTPNSCKSTAAVEQPEKQPEQAEKITPAVSETEREVVVSEAVSSISSTSKNLPKKRKKVEVIEIDEDVEKQFPITFSEFLEHTNVLDIVDAIARDARKHKSTQYTPDMVYTKKLARRLYLLFYTKIKYRKRKPLTNIKLSQNCPAYVKDRVMNVPKQYDTAHKRNSVANSNLELAQEAERRTSNDLTGTSKCHNSKIETELENLESVSISSGHSQKKTPTQAQTPPPPPPFEDFRKVVIMDEEFENHLTSLCAGNLEKIEVYRNQPNVRDEFEFSFYKQFYSIPDNRRRLNWKLRPCPLKIREQILTQAPLETTNESVEVNRNEATNENPLQEEVQSEEVINSRRKREYSNELERTLSHQTKRRKTLASVDVSAAIDSSNRKVPSPTLTSSKKTSPGENKKYSKNHQDERVLLHKESLKVSNETRSQSDCKNNESPNNCQEESVLRLNDPPVCSNKTSPKLNKNNDGCQNNEEGRILVIKPLPKNNNRPQTNENNTSKSNREKKVSVLSPTSKTKTRSRPGRNNDISESIQQERVSVLNEIDNSSNETSPGRNNDISESIQEERVSIFNELAKSSNKNKEYSKNKQEEIISILTDTPTSNKTIPSQLSTNKDNQENIHLFYNDKFLKKYTRKKITCDISEPQINLIVKRLNEKGYEKIREDFCYKVGVAAEVAEGDKRKTVVRTEGKSEESINELNEVLTTDESFSANGNTKEGHSNTMPVEKNNSTTEAGKGEAMKPTDKILIAEDALLKDKVKKSHLNSKEISIAETSPKNAPSDDVFAENREEQSTTNSTKEVTQTRSAPEVLNTKVGQDKTSKSGSGQQDVCRIDRCTTMAYVARRSHGLKQKIVCTIFKMSIDEFKKYTHIYERPRNMYEDPNILQKCYETALVKQIWYPKLYMSCQHIFEYLSTKGIVLEDLSLEYISPKLVFYEELASITNFDEIVVLDYFYEKNKTLDSDGDPELLKERRMLFYNRCWKHEKWIWRTPTFSESWKLITMKHLDNNTTNLAPPPPNSIATTTGTGSDNAEVQKETSVEVKEYQRNIEVVSVAVHNKELPRRDDNEETIVLSTQNNLATSKQSSRLKSKRITEKDRIQEQNIQEASGDNEKEADQQKGCPEKITPANETEQDEVEVSAAVKTITSTSKNSPKKRKKEVIEIDVDLEKQFPITFFEFLEHTNVLDIVDAIARDARKHKSTQYTPDMVYAKKLARRLYVLFYTKIKYRKRKPLTNIKLSQNCPAYVKDRVMNVPKQYDTKHKRNSVANSNLELTKEAERRTSNDLTGTSKCHNSKIVTELENLESVSISSGHSQKKTPTQAQTPPPPPPFEDFRKVVIMDEEFENHLTSLCAGDLEKIEAYRKQPNVRDEFEFSFYKQFYSIPDNRHRLSWKLRPCPLKIREQILTQAPLETTNESVEVNRKEATNENPVQEEVQSESVINSLINSCGLMTDAAVNKENCNFKYPISFEKFKACTYYKEITEEIFRNTTNYPKAFEEFKSNEALQNSLFRNYYEAFYKTPEIRSLFKIKIKPVPSNIKERILHVPSEFMDADALSTATKLEKKDKTSRMKREHSNELGKTLSPQTKRKTLASADVSAATDSSNRKVPSLPTPTSNKKTSPGKNKKHSKNHQDERVLLVNESLRVSNETRSQSDCQNNESPNNCQEESVLRLNDPPVCSNKTSPKPNKNNDGCQNNEEGRILVINIKPNNEIRPQTSKNNSSKINREKNVSVLLPTPKNKTRTRSNDISGSIQEESVSVHNEIANSSNENKEYSKNNQEEITSIITDSLTSNKTTPTQLSTNKDNIKGNQENIYLFYNDKFLKKYIRKKITCDISEPQVNLIVKRLNEEVFDKIREGFCHKVGVAAEVAEDDKQKTVVRIEGKPVESINELNEVLTTDEAFSANGNTKEGHSNTMPVEKNNSTTEAWKGEAVKPTDKILIAEYALLKDKAKKSHLNSKEISIAETSPKNAPSDVVFAENREEQSTTNSTKEVTQTRSAPEVLNTKVGQDKTSKSGSGQQDVCRIDRCTTMAYVARRSHGLKQKIVCTILKMSIDEFKKYTHIYERPRNMYEDPNILQKCYETALVKQIWYPKLYMSCHNIFEYLSTKGIVLEDLSLEYISPKLVFYEELASITNFDEIVALDYFYEKNKTLDRDGDPELLKERRMLFYNRCWKHEKWIWRTPTFSESWKLITRKQLDSINKSTTQLAPSPNSIATTPGSISVNNAEIRKEVSHEVNENQRNIEVVSIPVHSKELPRRDDNEETVVLPTQNTASQQSSKLKSKRITEKDKTQEQNFQEPPANNEEVTVSKAMVLLTPTPTLTPKPIQHDKQRSPNITTHVRKKKSNSLNLQANLLNTDLQTHTYLEQHHLDVPPNSINNGAFVHPSTLGTLDYSEKEKITEANGKTPLPLSPNVFISSSGSTTSQPHHSQPQATTRKSNSHRLSESNQRANDSNRMLNETTDDIADETPDDIANENPDDILSSIERTFESVDNEWVIVSSNSQTKSLKSGDEYILSSDPLAETLCEQAEENPTSSSYDPLLIKSTREQFVEARNCRNIVSAIVIEDTDSDNDDDALDSKFSAVTCKKEPAFLNKLSFTQTDSSSLFIVSPVESPPPIVIDDCNGQGSASETATNLMDLLMNPTGVATVPTLTYSGLSISNLTDANESRICEAQRLPSSLEESQKAPETSEPNPSKEVRSSKSNSISRKSNISSKKPAEEHSEAVEEFLSSDENYVAKQTRSTSTSARTQGREKPKSKSTARENRKKGALKPNCQIRIKDSHLVPQITHKFPPLPLITISKPKTNCSTNPPDTNMELDSTPPDENNERGNSLPSTQASAVSDTAKSVGCSNNSIAKSFSASQHLATDCTFFENTQLLRELDELRTNSKNKQNDTPSNAPASALTASASTASASTSTRMQVNEQAAPSNLSQETIFYRQLYQFHYFAALNEQQVAAYELPQLALGQQYMLAHIRMPSGQRIKVFGGDLLRLLFPTFSRNILCDVFYVLNDLREYHYSSVSRRSTEVAVDLRERALNLLFQSAPIFCYCGIKFDSSLPDYGICVPVSSVHNESINRKPFLPLTAALKPSLLEKMAQLKSQLASQK